MDDHPKLHEKSAKSQPVRRRQRQTLSCLPCRRLKVKCDRGHPCRHCLWSDRAATCQYAAFPNTKTNANTSPAGVGSSDEDQTSFSSVSTQTPPTSNKPQLSVLLPNIQPQHLVSYSASGTRSQEEKEDDDEEEEESANLCSKVHPGWTSKVRGTTHWLSVSRQVIDHLTCFQATL